MLITIFVNFVFQIKKGLMGDPKKKMLTATLLGKQILASTACEPFLIHFKIKTSEVYQPGNENLSIVQKSRYY